MSTKNFMVFQSGYAAFGFGEELWEAVEDANSNLEAEKQLDYENLDCVDCVSPEVNGVMYWTNNSKVIDEYKNL